MSNGEIAMSGRLDRPGICVFQDVIVMLDSEVET